MKFLSIIAIILVMQLPVFSATQTPQPQAFATYQSCLRKYQIPFEKLYYLALASVNANKYEILEMQSRSGYILFEANEKEFLLSVMKKDNKNSLIKITPADNSYAFSVVIPQRIFSYIDLNFNMPLQEIK